MGVVAALNGSFSGRDKRVSKGPITTCFGVAGGGTVGGAEMEGGKKVKGCESGMDNNGDDGCQNWMEGSGSLSGRMTSPPAEKRTWNCGLWSFSACRQLCKETLSTKPACGYYYLTIIWALLLTMFHHSSRIVSSKTECLWFIKFSLHGSQDRPSIHLTIINPLVALSQNAS